MEHISIRNIFCNYSESGSMGQMLCKEFYILAQVIIMFRRAELVG